MPRGVEPDHMPSPTWVKIQPFGGIPGENLDGFLARFERVVRRAVLPEYSDTDEEHTEGFGHGLDATGKSDWTSTI